MNALLFILLGLFWGGSFFAINQSLKGFSPFLAATLRVVFATLFALIYISIKKPVFPKFKHSVKIMLNGAIGVGLPWLLLFWGEQFVSPALASIINAISPIFTAIFAAIILKTVEEKMTWNRTLGVLLGLAGIVVIFAPYINDRDGSEPKGLLAIVGMAVCYGLTVAWLKKLFIHCNNVLILVFECLGALVVMIPATVIYSINHPVLTGGDLIYPSIAILYLSIFSTALAFLIFYRLIKKIGPVQATAVTYVVPIIAILLDLLFSGKWVGNNALLGELIVFAALRLINKPRIAAID